MSTWFLTFEKYIIFFNLCVRIIGFFNRTIKKAYRILLLTATMQKVGQKLHVYALEISSSGCASACCPLELLRFGLKRASAFILKLLEILSNPLWKGPKALPRIWEELLAHTFRNIKRELDQLTQLRTNLLPTLLLTMQCMAF